MSVIDILVDEHRLVRKYLDTLGIAIDLMGTGGKLPKEFLEKTLDFSNTFLDTYHHYKEEYVIFLKLAEKKGGTIDPQIVSLREQHERGRTFVKAISRSIDGYLEGSEVQGAKLFENLGYFYQLQRAHLNRENHVFFPMARKTFTEAEMESFMEEFKKEEARLGPETLSYSEKLVAQMDTQLAETFGDEYQAKRAQLEKVRAH
ncbi:MAG: hemerythrin domain-containing protein [bacterium]